MRFDSVTGPAGDPAGPSRHLHASRVRSGSLPPQSVE